MDSYGCLLPLFWPISPHKNWKTSKGSRSVYIIKRDKKRDCDTFGTEKKQCRMAGSNCFDSFANINLESRYAYVLLGQVKQLRI